MMRALFSFLFFVGLSSPASAEPILKDFVSKLPQDFIICAASTYGAPEKLEIQLDDSGHDARRANVVVNQPGKNVVLIVAAYEPTVWDVRWTAGTNIVGLIASGYHTLAVLGLPRSVPRETSTIDAPGKFDYFYADERRTLEAKETAYALLGRELDTIVTTPTGGTFFIGRPTSDTIRSDEIKLKEFLDPNRPLAGERGLEQLVREGSIRPATQADIDAWLVAERRYQGLPPDAHIDHHMYVGRTYVMQEPFKVPPGMYGANSRAFIIPFGAKLPTGAWSHNEYYIMESE